MNTDLKSNKKISKIDKYFGITEKSSSIGREILAGVIVFLAMIYILPTNVAVLQEAGMNGNAIFIATALSSAIATLFMGLVAKFPVVLSAGMGLNAFFTYTVCGQLGYTWQEALTITLISGVLFFILTLTPFRKKIIDAIPKDLRNAIVVGLGAFIAFVGLKNSKIIVSSSTLVSLGDLSDPQVLLALFGIILVFILLTVKSKKRIDNFAIAISLGATVIIGVILGLCKVPNMPTFDWEYHGISAIKEVFGQSFLHFEVLGRIETYAVIFSFIFVNLFDTTATVIAVGEKCGMINEKGDLIGGKKVLLADAGGAVISGILGVSPVTSFVESNVGCEVGGKTGLVAVVAGLLFLISIFCYPLFSVFTHPAVTGMALVAVGARMFGSLSDIDWKDPIIVFTTFLILVFSILCYSISDGLGIGLIMYSVMMLCSGRRKEVNKIIYIISIFFVINYVIKIIIALL